MCPSKVFVVGCGGITYYTLPYLSLLARRTIPGMMLGSETRFYLIDPDVVEEGNYRRQWPNNGGHPKATCAAEVLGFAGARAEAIIQRAQDVAWHNYLPTEEGTSPVFIVNPDNDECREFMCELFASSLWPEANLITGGCDLSGANAYAMAIRDGRLVWDFRKDLGWSPRPETPREPSCDQQTALANMMAGALVAELYEYMLPWVPGDVRRSLFWEFERSRSYPIDHEGEESATAPTDRIEEEVCA